MRRILLAVLAAFVTLVGPAHAETWPAHPITIVVPVPPGGTVSLYGTTIAQFMERYIPGHPNIIHEYRAGSGGVVAANYVFNAAPKDGTVFTTLLSTAIILKQLRPKAAKFVPAEFNFIGRMTDNPRVLITWHATGINSIEDARKQDVPIGSAAKLSVTAIHPLLMNRLAGTKFQIVNGYRGAGPSYLAMERGEIAGTTVAWDGLVGNRLDWVKEGKVKIILRMGSRTLPGYESVPELRDFGNTPEEKAVLKLMSLPADTGQVLAAPPGIPADRLHHLRIDLGDLESVRVGVEALDASLDLAVARVGGKRMHGGLQAHLFAGLDFVGHIDLRGGVVAHDHHRQAGVNTTAFERLGGFSALVSDVAGHGMAVDNFGCHGCFGGCWPPDARPAPARRVYTRRPQPFHSRQTERSPLSPHSVGSLAGL